MTAEQRSIAGRIELDPAESDALPAAVRAQRERDAVETAAARPPGRPRRRPPSLRGRVAVDHRRRIPRRRRYRAPLGAGGRGVRRSSCGSSHPDPPRARRACHHLRPHRGPRATRAVGRPRRITLDGDAPISRTPIPVGGTRRSEVRRDDRIGDHPHQGMRGDDRRRARASRRPGAGRPGWSTSCVVVDADSADGTAESRGAAAPGAPAGRSCCPSRARAGQGRRDVAGAVGDRRRHRLLPDGDTADPDAAHLLGLLGPLLT